MGLTWTAYRGVVLEKRETAPNSQQFQPSSSTVLANLDTTSCSRRGSSFASRAIASPPGTGRGGQVWGGRTPEPSKRFALQQPDEFFNVGLSSITLQGDRSPGPGKPALRQPHDTQPIVAQIRLHRPACKHRDAQSGACQLDDGFGQFDSLYGLRP